MLEIVKFVKKHIPGVKKLYDQYLVPMYLRRMGITKDEVTDTIKEFESILDADITSMEFYQGCSVVCVDRNLNNKVIGCWMGYCLNEKLYNDVFVGNARRYLMLENQPESVRSYAKSMIYSNDTLNVFKKYNLKKVLYSETGIVEPSYRGQGLIAKMRDQSVKLAGNGVTAALAETQIPLEVWEGRKEKLKITAPNEIILQETVHNGFLCLLILTFLEKQSLISKM